MNPEVQIMWSVEQHDDPRRHPLFIRSVTPMLVVDDERRLTDVNPAACLLLRLPEEEIRALRLDDLICVVTRLEIEAMWPRALQDGHPSQAREVVSAKLQMPDGTTLAADLGFRPHVSPGRHLVIVLFPAARQLGELPGVAPASTDPVLTRREREILNLVALGNTGVEIAARLFLSPTTVQSHVANALIKLGARNRAHGIAIASHIGEVSLDS